MAAPVVAFLVGLGLVLGVIGTVLGSWWLAAGFLLPLGYLAGVIIASLTHARDLQLRSLLLLPGVLVTMHMAWGTGYLRGIR